jgi:hypothetical protein
MTTDAHRCRVCGKTSDDEDMVRTGGEETEKADHDGSKRLDKREALPFQRGSPA